MGRKDLHGACVVAPELAQSREVGHAQGAVDLGELLERLQ